MRLWIAFMLAMVLLAARGHAADLATEIKALDTSNFAQKENAIAAIASTGDARVAAVMTALNDGTLLIRKSDRLIVIAAGKGTLTIENAATGAANGPVATIACAHAMAPRGVRTPVTRSPCSTNPTAGVSRHTQAPLARA